jgi:hypothetical protein
MKNHFANVCFGPGGFSKNGNKKPHTRQNSPQRARKVDEKESTVPSV